MGYVVLARKYRPQRFEDLIGQEHVARTLQNAIVAGRVAHAFLFTGSRGVGKTSAARILARALNCAEGPTPTPCGKCPPCLDIAAGTDMDVLEIDAASNTGVDNVRQLQESIPYRPARDRTKIYIVDEVHMLSVSAFNAFLKTLEEPPAHVKFIFATTEPHKIPVTVLSRCQRYDFRLIATSVIAERLRAILEAETIAFDDEAPRLLAREAAGSMRDALSLLDQVVAFEGARVDAEIVRRVLGVADKAQVRAVCAAVLARDAAQALCVVDEVARAGQDLVQFAREILGELRDLAVARLAKREDLPRLVDAGAEERTELLALAQKHAPDDLLRLLGLFAERLDLLARSEHTRTLLELAVAQLAAGESLAPLVDLVGRLDDLERRLAGAPSSASRGGPPPRSVAPPPTGVTGGGAPGSARSATSRSLSATAAEPAAPPAAASSPSSAPSAAPPPVQLPNDLVARWEAVLAVVAEHKPALASILEHAVPLAVDDQGIKLGFANDFAGRQAASMESQQTLRALVRERLGREPRIEIVLGVGAEAGPTVAAQNAERRVQAEEKRRAAALEHPAVRDVLDVFEGAQVKAVRETE